MQLRVAAIIAGAALAGLVQAGCSPGSPSASSQPPATDSDRVDIVVRDYAFEPASEDIGPNAMVVWTTEEGTHEVFATDGAQFDSGTLSKGYTFTWSPDFEGSRTISYRCKIHPDRMQGTITVIG